MTAGCPLRLICRYPGYRSERSTLRRLAASPLYLGLDARPPTGLPPIADLGARVAQYLARIAGADRESAVRESARAAAKLLGLRTMQDFSPDERVAWMRWAPLVASMQGLSAWSAGEKRALIHVIRAKGGRRESDFVSLFAAHPKLGRALFGSA
jgi:hypothetical protein